MNIERTVSETWFVFRQCLTNLLKSKKLLRLFCRVLMVLQHLSFPDETLSISYQVTKSKINTKYLNTLQGLTMVLEKLFAHSLVRLIKCVYLSFSKLFVVLLVRLVYAKQIRTNKHLYHHYTEQVCVLNTKVLGQMCTIYNSPQYCVEHKTKTNDLVVHILEVCDRCIVWSCERNQLSWAILSSFIVALPGQASWLLVVLPTFVVITTNVVFYGTKGECRINFKCHDNVIWWTKNNHTIVVTFI